MPPGPRPSASSAEGRAAASEAHKVKMMANVKQTNCISDNHLNELDMICWLEIEIS